MTVKERQIKEKLQRIQLIQSAARSVFLNKGYQASSMDEIARKAQVSKGTLYFYFRSKDDLYASLIVPIIQKLHQLLEEFERGMSEGTYKNGTDFIKGLLDVLIKTHEFDQGAFNIFQIFQLRNLYSVMSESTRDKLEELRKANFGIMRSVISNAIDIGYLRRVDPVQATDFVWGSFLGVVQLEEAKSQFSKKDHLPGMFNFFLSVLSSGLLAEKG